MIDSVLLFVVELGTLKGDVWMAIFLYIAVFIFSWSKGQLGDVRAAIIYALVIMLLIFYEHPDLIWVALGIYLFTTYGKGMFKV